MSRYDVLLVELLKRLDEKADKLIALKGNAKEIASLVLELQERQEEKIQISGTKGKTLEERKRLADTIQSVLVEKDWGHSSQQQLCPTSPEQSLDEESR